MDVGIYESGIAVVVVTILAFILPTIIQRYSKVVEPKVKSEFPIFEVLREHEYPWTETMGSPESVKRSMEFEHKPSDVFVLTVPKTGTTWLMQICHALRGGDMNFEDIYQVTPWPQIAWDLDISLSDQYGLTPRVFKTHQPLRCYAKTPGKYIVTVREPERVCKSFWAFMRGKQIPFSLVPLNEFWNTPSSYRDRLCSSNIRMWSAYVEFWKCAHLDNVLLLVFEDLVKDPKKWIPVIAEFMGIPCSPALLARVAEMSSKEFMAKHEEKYDESWTHKRLLEVGRLALDQMDQSRPSSHVTEGNHGEFTVESKREFDRVWKERVYKKTGLRSYSEFQESCRVVLMEKYGRLLKK